MPPSAPLIIAHENVLNRMTAQKPALPFGMLPTDTYFTKSKDLYFNGEAVQLLYQGNAHTDGDSLVFFRRSDVVSHRRHLHARTTIP